MGRYGTCIFFRQYLLVFLGIPLFVWAAGDFPERSLLKDFLSIITILAFCQMIGQFFWTRTSRPLRTDLKMSRVVKYHKLAGYTLITILSLHPFFLVIPRFFEPGISPAAAFVSIITTLHHGVVLGITAWCLMLVLGMTSFLRNRLPMTYKAWRFFHGVLAILLVCIGAWHTADLGRHADLAMSLFFSTLTAGGVLLLLKTYTLKKEKTER